MRGDGSRLHFFFLGGTLWDYLDFTFWDWALILLWVYCFMMGLLDYDGGLEGEWRGGCWPLYTYTDFRTLEDFLACRY